MANCFKVFFILYVISVLGTNAIHSGLSPDDVIYQCSRKDNCGSNIDQYIFQMLDEFQSKKYNACLHFFDYTRTYYSSHDDDGRIELFEPHFTEEVINALSNIDSNTKHKELTDLYHTINDLLLKCKEPTPYRLDVLENLENATIFKWPNWKELYKVSEQDFEPLMNWMQLLGGLRSIGLNNVFFKERVTVPYNDANEVVVELSMPDELGIFTENEQLSYLRQFHIVEEPIRQYKEFLEPIDKLHEESRSKRKLYARSRREEEKKLLTLADLMQMIPLKWDSYFEGLLQRPFSADKLKIQLKGPEYFEEIARLLNGTPTKTIAFYILIRFIDFYRSFTPHVEYDRCDEDVIKMFPLAANYLYHRFVENDFENKKQLLETMFEELKTKFAAELEKNKLKLNQDELSFLQRKLNTLKLRIGTTPLDLNEKFYNDYYEPTNSTFSLVENLRNLKHSHVQKAHEKLFHVTKDDLEYIWSYDDTRRPSVEPFFVPHLNVIVVPQEFLNPPFVNRHMNKVFQYATTGFGLARAIIAAFSPDGILFDSNGVESAIGRNIILRPEYQQTLGCLQNEALPEARMPDILGFRLLLDTYYNRIPATGPESTITAEFKFKSITFNVRKLFFQYFAQYFGGNYEFSNLYYQKEFEAPRMRLLSIVAQSTEFNEVFGCEDKTAGDREFSDYDFGVVKKPEKCQLW